MLCCRFGVGAVRSFFLFLLSFSVFSGVGQFLTTDGAQAADAFCEKKLMDPSSEVASEAESYSEGRRLSDLLISNHEDNLVFQSPSILMNAFQKNLAWVNSVAPRRVLDPELGGRMVTKYPTLSDPLADNDGRFIVGHYNEIDAFVSWLEAGARGDGSLKKMPVFVGPAGTGKTEITDVLNALGKNLAGRDPRFTDWTFHFTNLDQIPELTPFLNSFKQANGLDLTLDIPAPYYETPLALLPESYQRAILGDKQLREKAIALTGVNPRPFLRRSPVTEFFRQAIINHYRAANAGGGWTDRSILQALDKHIKLVRHIPNVTNGVAKMDAQGRDIDWSALFFSDSPVIKAYFGPGHPLAYFYNGLILKASGASLVLDEFFRNGKDLRNMFLGVVESRVVNRGSAFVPFDSVIFGASNDESIEEVKSDGGAKAQIDRTFRLSMRLHTHPLFVAKTVLLMKGISGVRQQKLFDRTEPIPAEGVAERPIEPARINDLYVEPEKVGEHMVGPEGRYALMIDIGPRKKPVFIAPHALELLSFTTAASRMVTDGEKALSLTKDNPPKVIHDPVFTMVSARIKAYLGQLPLQNSQAAELASLHQLLREGSSGISQRDAANIWFTSCIAEATRPENGNTITPQVVMTVFQNLLEQGKIEFPDEASRVKWLNLIDEMAQSFTIPAIKRDVMAAIGHGQGDIESTYSEIVAELDALNSDENAVTYTSPSGGETRPINHVRLREIQRIYMEQNFRPFRIQELVSLQTSYGRNGSAQKHELLLRAIEQFFADSAIKTYSIESIVQASRSTTGGSSDLRSHLSDVMFNLKYRFGYNDISAKKALEMIGSEANRRAQVPR